MTNTEIDVDRDAAVQVAEWLASDERMPTVAEPCRVTIGRATYVGAYFAQIRRNDPGTRAYAEGRRHYVHAGYYLLGGLPPSYVHRNADAYVTGTGGETYYVAGYYPLEQDGRKNDAHPFGAMFMLARDDLNVIEGPRRMPMRIEPIAL